MGKIYINCSRCGKDLECEELCDVYTSKIDDSFICKDCYKKEKPDYIQQLKQQLEEKDKEIETMKKDSDKNIDYLVEFASLIENEKDCNRMLKALDRVKSGNKYIIDKANQSKTEFAIQELEKLKEEFNGFFSIPIQQEMFDKYINKQIKELKR